MHNKFKKVNMNTSIFIDIVAMLVKPGLKHTSAEVPLHLPCMASPSEPCINSTW